MSYADIIKKRIKDWNCDGLMEGAKAKRGNKIPFSSPLLNYSTYGGIPRDAITEFFGAPGGGKAQPLYSKVLTPYGFKLMKDVAVGDDVFDGNGNICKVDGIFPQGVRPVYEITTQGNNKIRVADNHLNSVWWWNSSKHCREDAVWTTLELIENFHKYGSGRKIRIDVPEVDWEPRPVPLDPYLVGALIGDGSLADSCIGFSNSEKDVCSKVNTKLAQYDYELIDYAHDGVSYGVHVIKGKYVPGKKTYLRKSLEAMGLCVKSIDKHIPECYLLNCREVRLAFLQGLFDTDGHIQKDGVVEYSTSSIQLSDDFSFLVRSLGIRDTVVVGNGKYTDGKGNEYYGNISYQHLLKVPNGLQFFSSSKHASRYKDRQHEPLRNIISIDYVGLEECKCIHVDSPLHTYISDCFIPTHNTTTSIDICKNACELFSQEYSERCDKLREKAARGDTVSKAELSDLEEAGPKRVLYVDLEHSFDGAWAQTLGITDEYPIDIMQPPDVFAEDILQTVKEIIETGEVGLIVLDSIPSLVTQSELDKKFGERTVASLSGLLTIFCRKIVQLLTRYGTTLIVINQIRDNMDSPYVVNTPGGNALKFYCSLRIQFKIGAPVDFLGNELPASTENPAGYKVTAKIVKQKSAPNDRRAGSYYLMAHSGIRVDMDFAQLAVNKYGIIRKSAAWYTLLNPDTMEPEINENGLPVKVNGMAKVFEYLQNNPEYFNRLVKYITTDIEGGSNDVDEEGNEQ